MRAIFIIITFMRPIHKFREVDKYLPSINEEQLVGDKDMKQKTEGRKELAESSSNRKIKNLVRRGPAQVTRKTAEKTIPSSNKELRKDLRAILSSSYNSSSYSLSETDDAFSPRSLEDSSFNTDPNDTYDNNTDSCDESDAYETDRTNKSDYSNTNTDFSRNHYSETDNSKEDDSSESSSQPDDPDSAYDPYSQSDTDYTPRNRHGSSESDDDSSSAASSKRAGTTYACKAKNLKVYQAVFREQKGELVVFDKYCTAKASGTEPVRAKMEKMRIKGSKGSSKENCVTTTYMREALETDDTKENDVAAINKKGIPKEHWTSLLLPSNNEMHPLQEKQTTVLGHDKNNGSVILRNNTNDTPVRDNLSSSRAAALRTMPSILENKNAATIPSILEKKITRKRLVSNKKARLTKNNAKELLLKSSMKTAILEQTPTKSAVSDLTVPTSDSTDLPSNQNEVKTTNVKRMVLLKKYFGGLVS